MKYPDISELNCNTCTEKYISKHQPDFHKFLIDNYPEDLTWSERLYWFYNNISEYPVCICGKRLKYLTFKRGYQQFCSIKCSNNSPQKKQSIKQTCIERYGGVAPACSKDVTSRMRNTVQQKYNVDNVQQLEDVKKRTKQTCIERYGGQGNSSTILQNLYKKTNLDKYGVENPMKHEDIKNKNIKSFRDNHDVLFPTQLQSCKEAARKAKKNISIRNHELVIDTNGEMWTCKCPHPECNRCDLKSFEINCHKFLDRMRDGTEICTNLLPVGIDNTKNTSIELFVQRILEDYGVEYETNNRSILKPKELDIFIPSKNIAIECNGIYSHSSKYKSSRYHIDKTLLCREKGITLIHIWEDWIKIKPEIVRSIILNKLGLSNNCVIYARKCTIREVDSKLCNKFLDENHIQGRSQSVQRYGLYYQDELVSIMTFNKPRPNMGSKNPKHQWELVRFCNKLNTRVVGGASKLLKYFIKENHPTSIVSFSMNDISEGNLYKQLGFSGCDNINYSYWYIDPSNCKRYHRSSFTKSSIVERGWKAEVDDTWTESDAMKEQGYLKIYDSGQIKWIWVSKSN